MKFQPELKVACDMSFSLTSCILNWGRRTKKLAIACPLASRLPKSRFRSCSLCQRSRLEAGQGQESPPHSSLRRSVTPDIAIVPLNTDGHQSHRLRTQGNAGAEEHEYTAGDEFDMAAHISETTGDDGCRKYRRDHCPPKAGYQNRC